MNPTTIRRFAFYFLAILIAVIALAIDLVRLGIHCYTHRHDPLLRQCQPVPIREIVSTAVADAAEAIAPTIEYLQQLNTSTIQPAARAVLPYLEWVRTIVLRAHYRYALSIEPSIVTEPDVYWA